VPGEFGRVDAAEQDPPRSGGVEPLHGARWRAGAVPCGAADVVGGDDGASVGAGLQRHGLDARTHVRPASTVAAFAEPTTGHGIATRQRAVTPVRMPCRVDHGVARRAPACARRVDVAGSADRAQPPARDPQSIRRPARPGEHGDGRRGHLPQFRLFQLN